MLLVHSKKCTNRRKVLQVCAVVVYPQAKLEAESSSLSLVVDQESSNLCLNEDVFISQLIRRAVLLNRGFQEKVTEIVRQNAVTYESFGLPRETLTEVTSCERYERARATLHEGALNFSRQPSSNFASNKTLERIGSSNKMGGSFKTSKMKMNSGFKSRCWTPIVLFILLICLFCC